MKILPIKKREGWDLVTISSAWLRLPGSVRDSHLLGFRLGSCRLTQQLEAVRAPSDELEEGKLCG